MPARKRDKLDPRRITIGGKLFWRVELGSEIKDGKRHRLRKIFASRDEALTFAQLRKIERANYGVRGAMLSDRVRAEAIEATKILEPLGATIMDAVREYAIRMEQVHQSETVNIAAAAFLNAKTADGMKRRYLKSLRGVLARFSLVFGERRLADITSSEIDRWLRSLSVKTLTRNSLRARLSSFFTFCRQQRWITSNPFIDVLKAKAATAPPGILKPEEAARLLETASEQTLPIHAIGLFAGLRSAEIEQLEWRHVRWAERLIEVTATSAKSGARRLVTMPENLCQWLEPYRTHHGPLWPPDCYRKLVTDRRKAGLKTWPSNACRHSYASYHLAHFKDAPALSLELGHVTPQLVFAHYREVVTPSEAEKFWRIAPSVSGAVISAVA